jgi:hypothetical protein
MAASKRSTAVATEGAGSGGEVRRWLQPLPYPEGRTQCATSVGWEAMSAPNQSERSPICMATGAPARAVRPPPASRWNTSRSPESVKYAPPAPSETTPMGALKLCWSGDAAPEGGPNQLSCPARTVRVPAEERSTWVPSTIRRSAPEIATVRGPPRPAGPHSVAIVPATRSMRRMRWFPESHTYSTVPAGSTASPRVATSRPRRAGPPSPSNPGGPPAIVTTRPSARTMRTRQRPAPLSVK